MKIFSKIICTFISIALCSFTQAQFLFSYNSTQVGKEEFLQAFSRNNNNTRPTEKDYRDYLDLFIRYKLKVKAAYDRQLDTLPNQKAELSDFKNQVAEGYLNDEASFLALVNEAVERSQKDIHLSHIYIPLLPGSTQQSTDTAKAWRMAMDAYNELLRGSDFGNVATVYSADSAVRFNKGDIGYITVFTLPYQLENLAYNTAPGKFSLPYRGKSGYHIFKNMDERKAAGKMKAAQIMLPWPPDVNDSIKEVTRKRADSIYNALQEGAPFAQLAYQFRNDNAPYGNNGDLPEFGVGSFDRELENAAFSLDKNGDFTRPVLTAHGYHILLRKEKIPVNTDPKDQATLETIRQRVKNDSRMEITRKAMGQKIELATGLKKAPVNEYELMVLADSAFQGKQLPKLAGLSEKTVLFSFPKKQVYAGDLVNYLHAVKGVSGLSSGRSLQDLINNFRTTVAIDYYREHLEEYSPAFAVQVKEFKEGNLLFEIMQRNIWDKAAADTVGMKAYFDRNKNKYWWEPSANAVIFSSADAATADQLKEALNKSGNDWKKVLPAFGEKVQADSGRFEITQITIPGETRLTAGMLTTPVKSSSDERTTFAYIVKLHPDKSPRSFNEARGFVLNDYQTHLENNWINELKKKYAVKVDEKVFKSLLE